MKVLVNILIIAFSVSLAAFGEIQFSWLGFMFQVASLVFDANRLVMIQILLSEDSQKMDPLMSLYYYAPACAVMNFFIAWATEFRSFHWGDIARTGLIILVLNAMVAFMLSVSIVVLVGGDEFTLYLGSVSRD
jgi:hypothetical protein